MAASRRPEEAVPFWAQLEALPPAEEQEHQPCSICLERPPGFDNTTHENGNVGRHAILRIKNCGHTFGLACLLDLYYSDVRMNKCPTCRQVFRPPRSLVYDPTEDLIVPEEGNWAMNVPGRPGMRKAKKELAASASQQSVEESFYDLDFYDRGDERRLERRKLPDAFYVSGNYGSFRSRAWDGRVDDRGIVFDQSYETVDEAEFDLLHEIVSQSADVDRHAPKDLERVQYQFVTIRAPHMERNMKSLAEHMYNSKHYQFPPAGSANDSRLERLGQTVQETVRWFELNHGKLYQYKSLTEGLRQMMNYNWEYTKDESKTPALEKIFDHLIRGTVLARMMREMDWFGRLA